jgi:hypothetical protein
MRKNEACPSKFFKAKNYPDDWTLTVEIEMARMESFENGKSSRERLVVYFRRQKSGLVVGPTVWDQIVKATGEEDSDDWKGHRVELYRDWTSFQGENVECIRVRAPESPPKKAAKKPAPKKASDDDDDMNDEVPY